MGEEVPDGGAFGACRLIEIDRPLLDRDEHREPGEELRDGRPAQRHADVAVNGGGTVDTRYTGRCMACAPRLDRAQCLHGG